MVGTGKPEGIVALHPFPANYDVLQGIIEGMPDMKCTGYIGGRDDHRERPASGIGICPE